VTRIAGKRRERVRGGGEEGGEEGGEDGGEDGREDGREVTMGMLS
jgi:hypothetical protein